MDGYPDYPEDVMVAVKYLVEKGVTKSTEIAKRLGVSPYTARNIKKLLRRRGLLKVEEPALAKVATTKAKSKKPRDIIEAILGRGR